MIQIQQKERNREDKEEEKSSERHTLLRGIEKEEKLGQGSESVSLRDKEFLEWMKN